MPSVRLDMGDSRYSTCCHTFRATGITAYLQNGGTLEHAQQIAAHQSPRTTKLYDQRRTRFRSTKSNELNSEVTLQLWSVSSALATSSGHSIPLRPGRPPCSPSSQARHLAHDPSGGEGRWHQGADRLPYFPCDRYHGILGKWRNSRARRRWPRMKAPALQAL
jgi:hypothetical protein